MKTARWFARVIGLMITAFILALAVGQRLNLANLNAGEMTMAAALFVALVGMIVLWKWEGLGGVLVVGGLLVFYVTNYAVSGKLPGGWVFPLCFLPGVLSLFVWLNERRDWPSSS